MGALVSAPLACFGSCCGSCAGAACMSACSGKASSAVAKVIYYIIVFLSSLLALLMRYASIGFLDKLLKFAVNENCDQLCLEVQAATRICLALFLFFVGMVIFAGVSTAWHLGFWSFKLLIWIGLIVAVFFIPSSGVDVFINIAQVGAGLFLFMQLLVLITMAYEWNRRWADNSERPWLIAILVASVLLIVASMVSWGFFYSWFTQSAGGSCGAQSAFITLTVVVTVAFTLVSITDFAPHGALLTSAVLMAYCSFILWTALSADPSQCNIFLSDSRDSNVFGLIVAAITLAYRSFSFSRITLFNQNEKEVVVQGGDKPLAQAPDEEMASVGAANTEVVAPEELSPEQQSTFRTTVILFHVLMGLSALYVTMVVSDWGTANDPHASQQLNISSTVMYVNLITGWVCMAMYLWTLVAPRLFPNRDFGVDLDDL